MAQSKFSFSRGSTNIGSVVVGGIVLIGFFLLLFWIAKSVFQILTYLSPIMLIAALIIRYRVVTGYLKWLWTCLKTEPLFGFIYTVLTIIGFPIVSAYLLFKALASRKLDSIQSDMNKKNEITYTDYEVIEDHYLDINSEEDIENYKKPLEKK